MGSSSGAEVGQCCVPIRCTPPSIHAAPGSIAARLDCHGPLLAHAPRPPNRLLLQRRVECRLLQGRWIANQGQLHNFPRACSTESQISSVVSARQGQHVASIISSWQHGRTMRKTWDAAVRLMPTLPLRMLSRNTVVGGSPWNLRSGVRIAEQGTGCVTKGRRDTEMEQRKRAGTMPGARGTRQWQWRRQSTNAWTPPSRNSLLDGAGALLEGHGAADEAVAKAWGEARRRKG